MPPFHSPHPSPLKSSQLRSKHTNRAAYTPNNLIPTPITITPSTVKLASKSKPNNNKSKKSLQRANPKSTPLDAPSNNPQHLSLSSFCDQLSAEIYSHRSLKSRTNFKSKPSPRKSKKKSSKHHAFILPQSSDGEEVHSIFLPSIEHPSRSSTPSPTQPSRTGFFDLVPPTLALDELYIPTTAAPHLKQTPSRTLPSTTNDIPSRRRHIRAKSVASIFEVDCSASSIPQSKGAKDDWDMPTLTPPRDLTWQQKDKPLGQTSNPQASTISHLTHKLAQHDSKSCNRTSAPLNQLTKELSSVRQQKSPLARTSSTGTIKRFAEPVQATKSHPSRSSRSDDESALTWQQSIIRPTPKHSLPAAHSDHLPNATAPKPCQKKNQAVSHGLHTPTKNLSVARKPGVHSAIKSKLSSAACSSQRRNSLSFALNKLPEPTPIQSQLNGGQDLLSWKSFPSTVASNHPDLPPLCSKPVPIHGAQVDQTPRRHTKSYTHQPATLSTRRPTQSSPQTNSLFSNIPESNHHKMITPSKSRSASEDLNLASPENQLSTPALRAAFMYAGPQFHNSPCPQALPAPKFSFGSA